jgi:hypothetical protein
MRQHQPAHQLEIAHARIRRPRHKAHRSDANLDRPLT